MPKEMIAVRIGEYIALRSIPEDWHMHYAINSKLIGRKSGDDDKSYLVIEYRHILGVLLAYCEETKIMFELKRLIP